MLCLALYGPTTSARRSTSPIRSRYPPAIRCGERRTCSSLHISPAPSPVGNPERIDSPANRSAGTPRASHCSASGRGICPPVAGLVIEMSGQKANKTGREILEASMTIAVVGASRDPGKAGGSVPAGLQRRGFRIIPINPFADELFGERVYRSLSEVPFKIDIVDVFRPASDAPEIARQAVAVGAQALWLQLDIRSAEARRIAEAAGLDYVENECTAVVSSLYRIRKQTAA